MRLIIFGSSISWGAWDADGGWAEKIKKLAYDKAEKSNFKEYTSVYCLGVSGDNTDILLERFDTEINARTRLNEKEELVILVEIGINDSQYIFQEKTHFVPEEKFEKNLLSIIDKSNKHNAKLIFLGLTPVDNRVNPIPWKPTATYKQDYIDKYELILKKVAKEKNIPFLELMSKFEKTQLQKLLTDGVHPSTIGHDIIYNKVKEYLLENNII